MKTKTNFQKTKFKESKIFKTFLAIFSYFVHHLYCAAIYEGSVRKSEKNTKYEKSDILLLLFHLLHLHFHSFIHSFILAISIASLPVRNFSEVLPAQHRYCAGVSRRSTQSIAS